jgi:hypothetical protein
MQGRGNLRKHIPGNTVDIFELLLCFLSLPLVLSISDDMLAARVALIHFCLMLKQLMMSHKGTWYDHR